MTTCPYLEQIGYFSLKVKFRYDKIFRKAGALTMNLKAKSPLLGKSGNLLKRNTNILIAAGGSALLMVLVYYFFDVIPFGERTVLRMDMYHQYVPFLAEMYERVTNFDSLTYSWTTGLGNAIIGNYFNYLASPFNLLIFLFGHDNITEAVALIIVLKCALSSATFSYFIKKSFNKDDLTVSAFGVLYSFCSFFIAYYWNIMWTDALYLLPLVALGIEYIIKKGKCSLYCIALAFAMATNYYMAFMMCIFAVVYFLYYYFVSDTLDAKFIKLDPAEEKAQSMAFKIKNSKFLVSGAKFAVFSIVAAGIVAIALLPTYFALKQCSATSGTFPEEFKTYFNVFDFAVNHLADITPSIRSSGGNVLPNVYCGILVVILLPLFLFTKTISAREKIISALVVVFFFLSFNTNYLNYIWHGFHFPNDLPYRFSYMYSFFLLIFAYKTLTRINEFSKNMILATGGAIAVFVVVAQKVESKNLTELSVYISLAIIAVYTIVLLMMHSKRFQASAMASLVFLCAIAEVSAADTNNFSMSQTKKSYASDLTTFEALKDDLDSKNDGEFYRMELAHLRTRNDPSWYYYNGASTFTSLAYEKLSNLQKNMGMFGNYINSYTYNPQTPVYNAMFSLKYIVDNSTDYVFDDQYYTKVDSSGKFTAYENKYCLPIGFTVDSSVLNWTTDYTNPFDVQNEFFQLASGQENVFAPMELTSVSYNNVVPFDSLESTFFSYALEDSASDGSITFGVDCTEDSHVYVYVKSSSITDISVTTASTTLTQEISKPYILDAGAYSASENVSISLSIPNDKSSGSFEIYVYTIDNEKFVSGYNELSEGKLNVTEFDDTYISGTFTAKSSQILYTSIPYDTGWSVILDGEEVNANELLKIGDSLLGVNVSAGEHTIEFKFTPNGLYIGVGISVMFVALFILLLINKDRIEKFLKPIPKKIDPTKAEDRKASSDKGEIDDFDREDAQDFQQYNQDID